MLNFASALVKADSMVIQCESIKLILHFVHKTCCKSLTFHFLLLHDITSITPIHFDFIVNRKLHFLALTFMIL